MIMPKIGHLGILKENNQELTNKNHVRELYVVLGLLTSSQEYYRLLYTSLYKTSKEAINLALLKQKTNTDGFITKSFTRWQVLMTKSI